MTTTRPINTETLPWKTWQKGKFGSRIKALGDAAGGAQIGVVLEEIEPGFQSCPKHYHLKEEEHLWVLAGSVTLRLGDQEYTMTAGDYICFPAGQAEAHCLINHSDDTCRFLMIGGKIDDDVIVYPDSNKVKVKLTNQIYKQQEHEYWEGE